MWRDFRQSCPFPSSTCDRSGLSLFVIIVPIKRQFWSIIMWEKPTYALCCLLCIPLCISDCIPIMVYYGIFHSYLDYIYTGYFFWLNHRFCWLNHLYTVCFPPRNGWSLPETTPRATVNLTQSGRDEGSATTTLRPGSLSHWIPSSLMCRYIGGFRKWWISKVDGL